ncbi:MAG TPA: hypothetical protein VGP88_06950 [Thermoplasmata archaeon]|jgi:glutathione synthase/RimK-type ligase-like ATP-grasp enzyme|nr:hypothetical protein [Thermoplasmata archaeon]
MTVAHPAWDDPAVDWTGFRMTVVRSTWNYHHRRPEFLRWIRTADRVGDLWNRAAVLRWNTDKRYLRDLAEAGVPVVPTVWSPRGRPVDLGSLMARRRWSTVVVKPAISAAGERTFRVSPEEVAEGQRKLDAITRTGVAMTQPYLRRVARGGERSLVFLDGEYSHTVRRVPLFDGPRTPGPETLSPASSDMRRVAAVALRACPPELLYARVDLVVNEDRIWRVLEIELTEPSLFFVPCPRAATTLAAAIRRRLRR